MFEDIVCSIFHDNFNYLYFYLILNMFSFKRHFLAGFGSFKFINDMVSYDFLFAQK